MRVSLARGVRRREAPEVVLRRRLDLQVDPRAQRRDLRRARRTRADRADQGTADLVAEERLAARVAVGAEPVLVRIGRGGITGV